MDEMLKEMVSKALSDAPGFVVLIGFFWRMHKEIRKDFKGLADTVGELKDAVKDQNLRHEKQETVQDIQKKELERHSKILQEMQIDFKVLKETCPIVKGQPIV